jgi:hypothetical protein
VKRQVSEETSDLAQANGSRCLGAGRISSTTGPEHRMGIDGYTYIMKVSQKDPLLQRAHVLAQEIEPMLFHADLTHVNVTCRHVLVSTFKTWILCTSGVKLFQSANQLLNTSGFKSRGLFGLKFHYQHLRTLTVLVPSDHLPKFSISPTSSSQKRSVKMGNQ